jgi:hypothetical protein
MLSCVTQGHNHHPNQNVDWQIVIRHRRIDHRCGETKKVLRFTLTIAKLVIGEGHSMCATAAGQVSRRSTFQPAFSKKSD